MRGAASYPAYEADIDAHAEWTKCSGRMLSSIKSKPTEDYSDVLKALSIHESLWNLWNFAWWCHERPRRVVCKPGYPSTILTNDRATDNDQRTTGVATMVLHPEYFPSLTLDGHFFCIWSSINPNVCRYFQYIHIYIHT